MSKKTYIDRPPRIQPDLPQGEIPIPAPPGRENRALQSLIQLLLPMVTIGGYLLMGLFGRGRSIAMMIPMGLSVLASVGYSLYSRNQGSAEQEEKEAAYREKLIELRQKMQESHDSQKRFYYYNYPGSEESLMVVSKSMRNIENREIGKRPVESRLWERRTHDSDFGQVRIGLGNLPSTQQFKLQGEGAFEDPQMREALRLQDDGRYIDDVPIMIPLRLPPGTDEQDARAMSMVKHALGVIGQADDVYPFINAFLTHYVTFHSPNDTQLFVLSQIEAESKWLWALNLPHFNAANPELAMCFDDPGSNTGGDDEEGNRFVTQFLKNIRRILDERAMRMGDSGAGDVTLPHLVLFVDLLHGRKPGSIMGNLETDMTISSIIHQGPKFGASVIFMAQNRNDIPSGCSAIIEVNHSSMGKKNEKNFRYVEVGVNSPRHVGVADFFTESGRLELMAQEMGKLDVRKSYGTDLPRGVMMMDMVGCTTIEELKDKTRDSWRVSRKPNAADWLKMKLGMIPSGEYRLMKFSADADGVHGMIAGSTGSGKSELLMTMILELALNYDPSILNFVLVDFKGGGAFKPLEELPHVVDVVTNLEGSAVDRMFAAITAELNRRQAINTETNSKHLVHYREQGLHEQEGNKPVILTRGDGSKQAFKPEPYPHLFVFVDEFAEMVAENAEYKAQLNSITRLGRALGVTLILAAQRPAGAVTDQMRANIKFRICLRVETREDSSEILRRPDAAFLPTGIPGRGYLQVGNENLELVQVAWSGADYNGGVVKKKPNVIWLDRPETELTDEPSQETIAVFEAMVNMIQDLHDEEQRPAQRTPWPSFLPRDLSLQSQVDTSYISGSGLMDLLGEVEGEPPAYAPLNPAIEDWLIRDGGWEPLDWSRDAMRALVGIVDNPYNAENFPLMVDLRRNGHLVLFGASGFGKTTFLRTLLMTLAATHSPADLHAYVLDFAGGQMNIFQDLPHVGSVIAADEEELVNRLLRRLLDEIDRRREILRAESIDDVYIWNHQHRDQPEKKLPAIMLMVDNFAEFKENFEDLLPNMTTLVREGRAFGIHVILAAEQPNAVTGKLYGLFNMRLTLKLSDEMEYVGIVGRGARGFGEIEGRGYIRYNRQALEFQTALPVGVQDGSEGQKIDITKQLVGLIGKINDYDSGIPAERLPQKIKPLPKRVLLDGQFLAAAGRERQIIPPIGIDDRTLTPWKLNLPQLGPHIMVIGPPNSGKTTALRTILYSLTALYTPQEVRIVLIDFQKRFFNYGGKRTADELPHVIDAVDEVEEIGELVEHLKHECTLLADGSEAAALYVIIDNFSDFVEEVDQLQRKDRSLEYLNDLGRMARKSGTDGLHFVIGGGLDAIRINTDLRKRVTASRFGIGIQTADAVTALNGKPPRGLADLEPPAGRAFAVKAGRTSMLQIATPYQNLDEMPDVLDQLTAEISKRHAKFPAATWHPLPEPEEPAETAEAEAPQQAEAAPRPTLTTPPSARARNGEAQRTATASPASASAAQTSRQVGADRDTESVVQINKNQLKNLDIASIKQRLIDEGFLDDFGASFMDENGIITLALRKKIVTEEEIKAKLK